MKVKAGPKTRTGRCRCRRAGAAGARRAARRHGGRRGAAGQDLWRDGGTGCQGQGLEDTLEKPRLLLWLSSVTFGLLTCDCLSTAVDSGDKEQ